VSRTALLVDAAYSRHRNPPGHPERPERIEVLLPLAGADATGGERLVPVRPRPATAEEILAVHRPSHLERVAASAGRRLTVFDADTSAGEDSFETALLAAGGVLEVIDAVVAKRVDNGFALVRPPGHHAESDRVMGFCLFNNVAVGAEYARRRHGLDRILIVDWDVHHGNGTQEIFWSDGGVMYVSFHQYPFYPGTGAAHERGEGAGEGATLNLPLAAGSGDAEVLEAFRSVVEPAARRFAPDMVLVSAGFDAHRDDPLASLTMTREGFAELARGVLGIAEDCCDGRLVAVLEGGYDLDALRACVDAVLAEMSGVPRRREEETT